MRLSNLVTPENCTSFLFLTWRQAQLPLLLQASPHPVCFPQSGSEQAKVQAGLSNPQILPENPVWHEASRLAGAKCSKVNFTG